MTSIRPAVLARLGSIGNVQAVVTAYEADHTGADLEDLLLAILESYETANARPDLGSMSVTEEVRFWLPHFGTALAA